MTGTRLRARASARLVRLAVDLAAERREIERGISAAAPGAPTATAALEILTPARWAESLLVWVGFRLQPRVIPLR